MFLVKILLLSFNLKFIISYTRVTPIFSFNNTVSCGTSVRLYNKFPTDCGISNVKPTINEYILNTRLINGENSRKLSWPWIVYLAEEKSNKIINFKCSATLIHNQYVLTLAACVDGISKTNLIAIIGLGELKNVSESNNIYNVTEIINYKQFDRMDGYSSPNLALIKLSRIVDSRNNIKPICLPNSNDGSKVLSKTIVVTSW
jgi:secreted trypsin-like serine protease